MSDFVFSTNDADFERDVLAADLPVLVDFWAEWCQPCRAILPVIDRVAQKYSGKLKVYKINIDESSETPAKYGVLGVPTLLLVKGGEVVANHVGALSESQLVEFIDGNL